MPTRAQTAATIDAEITGGTYAAPPTAADAEILSTLVAAGVLTPAGAYVVGRGIADLLQVLSVPSIFAETLERLDLTRGI